MKLAFLISTLLFVLFGTVGGSIFAAEEDPVGFNPTKCNFTSGSGLLNLEGSVFRVADADTCSGLLADYMVAMINFFFRLAITLAVLMIAIGGFQWLMAIGNSSKIANAKDTIQQAVVGLIIAMTATLLFSQIDTSFTEFDKSQFDIRLGAGDYTFCQTIEPTTFYFQAMQEEDEESVDDTVKATALKIAEEECGKQSGRCTWKDGKCQSVLGAEGSFAQITGNYTFKDGTLAASVMVLQLACLSREYEFYKTSLRITEAYPPTGNHAPNSKHSNGCAVDITVPAGNCELVAGVVFSAHNCGLQTIQEYLGCDNYQETADRTADHVHVSMSQCP